MNMTLRTAATTASLLFATAASAQISLTGSSPSYLQDFNNLLRTTAAETWVNNVDTTSANDSPRLIGLNGWYTGSFGTATTTPQIRAGTGTNTAGSFYSFGASNDADRALGTLPTDASAAASMRLGVRFVNNTGFTIDSFTFSYTGEQWRKAALAAATNNQYVVSYAIFESGLGTLESTGYSAGLTGATFNTPIDGGDNVGTSLDGNSSANRVTGLGSSVTALTLAPGQELWLRWFDSNSPGADHGLAIDDFSISFTTIPEPSTVAALTGLGALAFAAWRRRRS